MALEDPGIRITLGREDPLTAADGVWTSANAHDILFSRTWNDADRAQYVGGSTFAGLYINFTTMLKTEYTAWVAEFGAVQIDAYLATDTSGDTYGHINNSTEFLCDFSNNNWIDFRVARMEDTVANLLPSGLSNLDYVFLDLCPLYPVSNLIGSQGNPYADSATWKTNMLAGVARARTRIHSSYELYCNGLREFLDETGFKDDPAIYETFDGTALVDGTHADGVSIEAGIDYSSNGQEWLFVLRAMYRCSNANKKCNASFKVLTTENPLGAAENQRRLNNFCSYALIHEDTYTVFQNRDEGEFSPYPISHFPENAIDLGVPATSVDSVFTDYSDISQQLFTRVFTAAGYVVLFNFSMAPIAVPSAYTSGYEQITFTTDIEVAEGVSTAALGSAPVPATVGAGEGMLLQAQTGTLTVTSGELSQLSGTCTVFYGVGPTGLMLDTGEFTAGNGEATLSLLADKFAGSSWEVSLSGSENPGDRSSRPDEFVDLAGGTAEVTGAGGRGRWVRAILRAFLPTKHTLGAAELDIDTDDN